jgi:FdhD protein
MTDEIEEQPPTREVEIIRVTSRGAAREPDQVVQEWPVLIHANGVPVGLLMALPGYERELAAGFALSEGIIRGRDDLLAVEACQQPREEQAVGDAEAVAPALLVRLTVPADRVDEVRYGQPVVRFACGTVGKSLLRERLAPLGDGFTVSADVLPKLYAAMTGEQLLYRTTGGTHAAAVFDREGRLVVLREDVGRHNALDKVLGHCLLEGIAVADKLIVTSGRASGELVLKAVAAGAPVLAAISAPTALAVAWAEQYRLTLIAFLKPRRANVYSGAQRIEGLEPDAAGGAD